MRDLEGVDIALVGIPFDTGTSFRVGARFGPEAVRSGSTLLRPYNPNLGVDVFATQSVVDYGDLDVTPGDTVRSLEQIADGLRPIAEAGVTAIAVGGDHTIVLGELRAHAAVHGPLALVLLDAHVDTNDEYYGQKYFHGTPFRRAFEEGLIDAERSIMAGMRGSTYDDQEWEAPREMGMEVIPCEELRTLTPEEYGRRARERGRHRRRVPVLRHRRRRPRLRARHGHARGRRAPPARGARASCARSPGWTSAPSTSSRSPRSSTGPAQVTAMLAANVAFEMLALRLLRET